MSALVYCPFPDADSATQVARALLEKDLIACANILGPSQSIYKWNDQVEHNKEIVVVLKTHASLLKDCIRELGTLHPYDSPAILGWECDAAHPATQEWLEGLAAEQ